MPSISLTNSFVEVDSKISCIRLAGEAGLMHCTLLRPPVDQAATVGRVAVVDGEFHAFLRPNLRIVAAGSFASTASHPSQR